MSWNTFGLCVIALLSAVAVAWLAAFVARQFSKTSRSAVLVALVVCAIAAVQAQKRGGDESSSRSRSAVSQRANAEGGASLRDANAGVQSLTAEHFERGFVMTRVGTNEVFDFSAPEGAVVSANLRAHGVARQRMHFAFSDWAFNIGTNSISRFRAYSVGKAEPITTNSHVAGCFAPLFAPMGIAPASRWNRLPGNEWWTPEDVEDFPTKSQFWHYVTPSNTLQMTWQNALLDRSTNSPASFQVELWPSGRFVYRYDLSRLQCETITNVVVGAAVGGQPWVENEIPTNVTSMTFYPVSCDDMTDPEIGRASCRERVSVVV